jgi:hypothetical protein
MTISWTPYRQTKLGLGALIGVAVLLANPPYRFWALATLPMIVFAALSLPKQDRLLPCVAYVLLGLSGFAIGQFFWQTSGLSWSGIKLMLLVLAAAVISAIRIFVVRSDEA